MKASSDTATSPNHTDSLPDRPLQENTGEPLLLNMLLYPQRSMKRRHFHILLWVLGGICGLASLRFYLVGAWPVAGFLLLDVVAVWFAFFVSYRRGRVRETIQLSSSDLIITRTLPGGQLKSWRFEPYWVKVSCTDAPGSEAQLSVHHHEKRLLLGSFLRTRERRQVAREIKSALSRWHEQRHEA